ncbi:MAG: hypothetical protein ACRCUY_05390 [Thermoguttaceae bacterium]
MLLSKVETDFGETFAQLKHQVVFRWFRIGNISDRKSEKMSRTGSKRRRLATRRTWTRILHCKKSKTVNA